MKEHRILTKSNGNTAANGRLWRVFRKFGRRRMPPAASSIPIPKFQHFKDYAAVVAAREAIACTFDWRYHSTARFFIRTKIVRIGYGRLKECYLHDHYVPEWSRGTELCKTMTKDDPLLKARWVILHELTHAKLVEHNFRDAHNKTFYKMLAAMAENHLGT